MEKFQGAEAVVEIEETVSKKRIHKPYRHPELDERIRLERNSGEASIIRAARRGGVNVPKVLDETEFSIEMEKINGERLAQKIEESPSLAESVGDQLAVLHSEGIVHGDLTTSNVLVGPEEVFLIDLGLAERSERNEDRAMDLHLFKNILSSSHPDVEEEAWSSFLEGYSGKDFVEEVLRIREEISERGRYL